MCLFFSSEAVFGQWTGVRGIESRIDSLNNLARDNFRIDFNASTLAAQEALELSFEYNYSKGLAYAYRNLAILSYFSDNLSYSLDYIFKSLEIFEKLNDQRGIADCHISLGTFFYRLGESESALKYHTLAYEYFKGSGPADRLAIAAYNLAESYFLNENFGEAEKYMYESISVNDIVKNIPLLASAYMYLGKIRNRQEAYSESINYLTMALEINGKLQESKSNKEVIIESHYLLGLNYMGLNQPQVAKAQFEKSLEFSEKYNLNGTIGEALLALSELALSSRDIDESISILNRFRSFYITTNQTKNQNARNLIQDLLELRNIEREALLLKAENQAKEDRILWLTISSALLILIGLLLFALLFFYFRLFKKSKELQQLKSRFIAMAVHEFKNPIGVISTASDLLKIYQEQLENPTIKQKIENQIKKIDRQEKRLNGLVDDLMIFESLFMNTYIVYNQEFDIVPFIKEIIEDCRDFDPDQRLAEIDALPTSILVNKDQILISHLFTNILGNAYKYSVGRQAPICSIQQTPSFITVTVQDFGIGIPEAEQKSIFKEFFRASNVGDKKGSGIGLAIVNAIVQKLNGSIKLTSELNKGTKIAVSLPTDYSA
ncbi:ATP-binding protein [Mongoliitalea lutea]|uniref:histidine kinase n=1 Tax=Mongoliitalea lutea TaxID=849756 RepID=A0A8J3CU66_9BACT|nr:tetratricopeptide repeat-containing sensor histidine kinase [Mongoliitalea lutea]GHB24391.1 hypothetical protein GCM10008106_01400 [Mongoliitalea lutea]